MSLEVGTQRDKRLAGWGMGELTPKLGKGAPQETEPNARDPTPPNTKVQSGAREDLRSPLPLQEPSVYWENDQRTCAGFSGQGWGQNENGVSVKILTCKRYTQLLAEEQPDLNFLQD